MRPSPTNGRPAGGTTTTGTTATTTATTATTTVINEPDRDALCEGAPVPSRTADRTKQPVRALPPGKPLTGPVPKCWATAAALGLRAGNVTPPMYRGPHGE